VTRKLTRKLILNICVAVNMTVTAGVVCRFEGFQTAFRAVNLFPSSGVRKLTDDAYTFMAVRSNGVESEVLPPWCCLRCETAGMWCSCVGLSPPYLSKDSSAFIFRVKQLELDPEEEGECYYPSKGQSARTA
jgi:hypothetical protein